MKKPIIPTLPQGKTVKDQLGQVKQLPRAQVKEKANLFNKKLERENWNLKLLVQELEYRLTLLSNVYEQQL